MLPIISSGLLAANKEISTISNNISNANSTGFKRSTTEFQDIYAKTSDKTDNAYSFSF
ncbi:MAG: flagellar basal body protein [Candidatus Puniceispirillales bacterium]